MSSNALTTYQKVNDPIAFSDSHAEACASLMNCNKHQGKAVALTCLCEGLTPIEFARRYHLVQGKPAMRADAMLAEFRMNHNGDYDIIERSPTRAAIKLTRDGKTFEAEFTWEEAKQSRWPWNDWKDPSKGLKDNWGTPTDQRNMLWARLVSDSFRVFCPELVAGVYTPEELGDVIEGEIVNVQSTPMTASQFQASQAAAPADGSVEVVEATDEIVEGKRAEDTESRLVATVRDLFVEACGDDAPKAMDAALKKRGVSSLHNLDDTALIELRDKLTAMKKQAVGN